MRLIVERVENGYIVSDVDGRQWIALDNEYQSVYSLTLAKILVQALEKPKYTREAEQEAIEAPYNRIEEAKENEQ